MVQATTSAVVEHETATKSPPTLAQVEAFARAAAIRYLLPRFGTEDAVRRFSQVYTLGSRIVVSAAIEQEALALATHVIESLRERFGVEAHWHENADDIHGSAYRRVFYAPASMPCRHFAAHLDIAF